MSGANCGVHFSSVPDSERVRLNFEQVQFVCPDCRVPGLIRDVFVSPTLVLLHGECFVCGYSDGIDVIDLLAVSRSIEAREKNRVCRSCFQRRNAAINLEDDAIPPDQSP